MKNIKNMLAFVLALVLVVGCIPFAAFASTETAFGFSDFPTGWSNVAMTDAVENGLITGFGDGTVRPRQLLTRAEMAAIMVRAFGAEVAADIEGKYSDVTPDKWYYDEMAKAVNMRIFAGYEDSTMHPESPITRQEAILVIARALVINSEDPHLLDVYTDKEKIGDFAKGALATFTLRGYIHGYEDSTIRPTNNITREEFAQIMYNIFAAYVRTDGSFTIGNHEGEVILTGDNVHLYSSLIDGDLIIGDGVGATNVTLENVIIKGRLIFRGGEGLVTLRNVTKEDLIVTNDFNGTVNFNHYSTEHYFKNAVYNTPASFLNRTVAGGTASGTGLGKHDTHVEGRVDAGTGEEEKKPSKPVVVGPGGGGTTPETKTYDITVDPANGDPTIKYEDITAGKTFNNMGYELPDDPTKDGYKFNGWYTEANGLKRPFTESTKVNKNDTVYADWLPGVFFYEDSTFATQFGEAVYVEEGEVLGDKFPADEPTRTGFTFKGWKYNDGTGEKDFTADTVVTKPVKVYATWEEITTPVTKYTVTFYDDKGGNVFGTPIEVEENTALGDKFPTAEPTKDGFTFVKWATEGDVEFTKDTVVTGNLTVYPIWEEVITPVTKYTVTFYDDKGGNVFGAPIEVEENTALGDNFPTAEPTKDGFTFVKWATEGDVEFTKDTAVTGNLTVYPIWEEVITPVTKYTVTFYDDKGGNVFGTPIEVEENTALGDNFPTEVPTKDGFTFVKWATEGDVEFTKDTPVTGDLTVYPIWEEVTTPVTKYTVTFYDDKGGNVFGTPIEVEENTALGDNFPTAVPTKDGFTFVKWATEGDVEFTKDTLVTGDLTVYPIWEEIEKYTVIFYEYGWMDVHSTEVEPGATVESDEIDTAYNALSTPFEQGYEANQDEESYISDATTARIHEIEGQWYYLVDGAYEVFDDTVVVNSDLEVYYYFDYMYALVSLESIFGKMGNYQFEAPFADDTLAAESVLDLLWLNRAAIKTIAKIATDPVFGKSIKLGDIIEYMPVNEKGEIMNPVYDYRLIKLLGEATVREYTTDAVADMVESDEEILRSAINEQLELASVPENVKARNIVDTFIMSDDSVKAVFVAVAKEILKTQNPEYSDPQIDALADEAIASKEKRLALIQLAFADSASRLLVEDASIGVVSQRIENEQECEFTKSVVKLAESKYQDEIETFIHQLKNDDYYLINTEDDGTDRRFIINAVSKKLHKTTYEEIKAKLPSVIFKVLDEDVAMDIFTTTLGNYTAEVDAVKAAVAAPDYDGTEYWVSSYVPVVVNPITQVLIPTYDKAMAKLDPKIKGYKYYTENPFIAELEALVHYNELIEKVDSPSEGASGYALYMDGDSIDADVYYSLVYKMAVLSYDAVDWMIENVPEPELDATIQLMADRLSGFYDKLADKVAQLGSGKPAQIRDKVLDYLNKAIDKDNTNIWNTVTPTLFDEKLDKIYAKGTKLVLEKSGFDVTKTITVEIADDCKTITLTQGTKVVSKSISDIAKDISAAGFTVSVNGSVISVDGKFEIDVAEYAKKIANKLGYVFNISFYEDTAEIAATPEVLRAYVLNINSDYVKLQIRLK
ncbi:MAG: hypothetical protein E7656_03150 [Ruminococcaceae bacterium]|nr:hypothetical protein [Oscillospiraceae bacterium]